MTKRIRYHISEEMHRMCAMLKIEPGNVLRRAGLPRDYFDQEDKGLLPHHIFALWNAATQEYGQADLPVTLGKLFANTNFGSIIFAFTCSKTVAQGFDRIAVFKPLVGPIKLDLTLGPDRYDVVVKSTETALTLPPILGAMDLVFFVELIRNATAEHVVPIRATLPEFCGDMAAVEAHIGIPVSKGPEVLLSFDAAVAEMQLVTENPSLWSYFEKDLTRRLDAHNTRVKMATRVQAALYELLPAGRSTVDAACAHLNLSKRSLQRHLASEGTTFQSVLDATRSELSLHYLRKNDMSVEEISYLLAYRDPNSFYRAFHNWTGMTPAQARQIS